MQRECIYTLLTKAQHIIFQQFSAVLEPFGLTPGQYGILRCLWENGSCTPKELAQTFQLEASTVTGILDRLEEKGLLKRYLNKKDRRSILIRTTKAGAAIQDEVLQAVYVLNQQFLGDINPGKKEAFLCCLKELYSNLQK